MTSTPDDPGAVPADPEPAADRSPQSMPEPVAEPLPSLDPEERREPSYFCSFHPDRRAQGVCMTCRKVICNECSTKIDGVNHCIKCLQAKAEKPQGHSFPVVQHLLALTAVAGLYLLIVTLVHFHAWWDL